MSAGSFTGILQVSEKGPKARFLVSELGRFAQPDSIVPSPTNPQNLNRYSYVLNSPINFTDPTGHFCESGQVTDTGYCINSNTTSSQTVSAHNYQSPTTSTCDNRANTHLPACMKDPGPLEGDPKGRGAEDDLNAGQSCSTCDTSAIENSPQYPNPLAYYEYLAWLPGGIDAFLKGMELDPFTWKGVQLHIPNFIGGTYNVYDATVIPGVSNGTIRKIGRALGDDLGGPLLLIGWAMTVAPNIIDNYKSGATQEEFVTEFVIDHTGFWFSEIGGDYVGVQFAIAYSKRTGSPKGSAWPAIGAQLGADYIIGVAWDELFYGADE